jgi:hypothetical protein
MSRPRSPETQRRVAALFRHISVTTTMFARRMRWLRFSDDQIRRAIYSMVDCARAEDEIEEQKRLRMTALVAMEKVLLEPNQAPMHERN